MVKARAQLDENSSALLDLMARPQWVLWRSEIRVEGKPPTKIPFHPKGFLAKSNDPSTWSTYEECMKWLDKAPEEFSGGVGFVFTKNDRFVFIDLDNSYDPKTKQILPWAKVIADRVKSYTEVSPSGTGLHIFCLADPVDNGDWGAKTANPNKLECYFGLRFATVTGRLLHEYPDELVDAQEAVEWLWRTYFRAQPRHVPRVVAGLDLDKPTPQVDHGPDALGDSVIHKMPWRKHEALMENSPTFKKTWERRRRDIRDDSLSGYDMSLAVQALQSDWTDEEVAALIAAFRERNGSDKWRRRKVMEDTIAKAKEWVTRGMSERDSADAVQELKADGAADGGNKAREYIKDRTGIDVEKVIQYGHDPAIFYVVVAGREVRIGDEGQFISQNHMQKRLFAELHAVVPGMKMPVWQQVLRSLTSLIEVRDDAALNHGGRVKEMVYGYLNDHPPTEIDSGETKNQCVLNKQPFTEGRHLLICMTHVEQYLSTIVSSKDMGDIRLFLKAAGFASKTVSCRDASGKGTSRTYWEGPLTILEKAKEVEQ